jgi:hypothetical protein
MAGLYYAENFDFMMKILALIFLVIHYIARCFRKFSLKISLNFINNLNAQQIFILQIYYLSLLYIDYYDIWQKKFIK